MEKKLNSLPNQPQLNLSLSLFITMISMEPSASILSINFKTGFWIEMGTSASAARREDKIFMLKFQKKNYLDIIRIWGKHSTHWPLPSRPPQPAPYGILNNDSLQNIWNLSHSFLNFKTSFWIEKGTTASAARREWKILSVSATCYSSEAGIPKLCSSGQTHFRLF